jgi:hypothetical protein
VSVFGNTIADYRIGIHAINIPSPGIGIDIGTNTIAGNEIIYNINNFPLTEYHGGIWLQNCRQARIVDNTISNTDFNTDDNFRGIDVESSLDCDINCNIIEKFGVAINLYDDCGITNLRRNEMDDFYRGIWLNGPNGAKINVDQGGANNPWDNKWDWNPASFLKVDGAVLSLGQINWYHQDDDDPTKNFSPNPWQQVPNSIINPEPNETSVPVACNDFSRMMGNRLANFGLVVGDSATYKEDLDESRYLSMRNSYIAMKNDSSIIYRGDSLDSDFETFFASLDTGNVGKLEQIKRSADADPDAAKAINASIVYSNSIEQNLKTFYFIFFDILEPGLELEASDTTTLEAMFSGNAINKGESFFNSLASLFREKHPESYSLRLGETTPLPFIEQVPETTSHLIIYPNPADNLIVSQLLDVDDSIILLELYNAVGKLVLIKKCNSKFEELNVSNYREGLYRLRAITNNGQIYTDSFSLVR